MRPLATMLLGIFAPGLNASPKIKLGARRLRVVSPASPENEVGVADYAGQQPTATPPQET